MVTRGRKFLGTRWILLISLMIVQQWSRCDGQQQRKERHWVVGSFHAPPYAIVSHDSDGKVKYIDGYVPEVVRYIAEKHGYTLEYAESKTYGINMNGTWNGLVGSVIKGEVDVAATNLLETYGRSKVVDLTVYLESENEGSGFICPFPTVSNGRNSISGIMKPFQYEVWIFAGAALLIIPVVLHFIAWVRFPMTVESKMLSRSVMDSLWFILRILLNAHDNLSISFNLPGKMLAGFWCLMAVVFVNAYTGSVTSYIMAPSLTPFVDSAKDIAALAPRPILMTDKFSALEASFMDETSGIALKIGDTLRATPENRLQVGSSYDVIPEKVNSNGGRCYAQATSTLQVILAEDVKKTGKCRMYIAREQWPVGRRCIALSKNNPLTKTFNKDINWVRQVGLLEAWRRRFWPLPHKCSNPIGKSKSDNTLQAMSLEQIGGAFIVFIGGVGISIFAFLCELIVNLYSEHRNA